MSKIFDSRDTEYKSPFGAAVCGATVRFAVRPGDENVTGVTLLLRREFAGTEQEVALSPGDDGRWQGVYTAPEEPELVWYAFRFSYPEGQRLYGLHGFDDQARWQLTVYDDSRPTPAWFGRGIGTTPRCGGPTPRGSSATTISSAAVWRGSPPD